MVSVSDEAVDRKFREYFPAYVKMVISIIVLMCGPHVDAEGLAQEVFTRFYLALLDGKRIPHPVAYIRRCAANISVDYLRQRSSGEVVTEDITTIARWDRMVEQRGTDEVLDYLDFMQRLEKLPPVQRQVLMMKFLLDMKPAEIAKILGIKAASVTKYTERALMALRTDVEPAGVQRQKTHMNGGA